MTDHDPQKLTDLTVDDQKDELQNLSKKQLEQLKEDETRNTALDNIKREIRKRNRQKKEEDNSDEISEGNTEQTKKAPKKIKAPQTINQDDIIEKVAELEQKVDYLIEKCKTTSEQGFENYEN